MSTYGLTVSSRVFCFFLLAVLPRLAEGGVSDSCLRFVPPEPLGDDVFP